MYDYNKEYAHELFSLYGKLVNLSDVFDTSPEMVLNDLSNYHLRNY